jgi:hypothetical protein
MRGTETRGHLHARLRREQVTCFFDLSRQLLLRHSNEICDNYGCSSDVEDCHQNKGKCKLNTFTKILIS